MTNSRFLWGASTASYQVEGESQIMTGIFLHDHIKLTRESPPSQNQVYSTRSSTQVDLQSAGDAAKFWDAKYYKRDFDLARSLGLNAFRISIEWARIEPEKDHWDQVAIDHYREMYGSHEGKRI